MPRRLFEAINNWAGGVNTAANADALPPGVSPRGKNSALTQMSPAPPRALPRSRRGGLPATTAVLSGEPSIIGQFWFERSNGNNYHVLVGSDGSFRKRNSDGTVTTINATAFTAGVDNIPSFAVANDLLFIMNGIESKKFDGTTLTKFGIDIPVFWDGLSWRNDPPLSAVGSGGVMAAGQWDVLVSYYNTNTGHEGRRSQIGSITLTAGQKLQVVLDDGAWPDTDPQVTHAFIYVRNPAIGPNFYRAIAGSTPAVDGTGGIPIANTSVELNISATQFANFRILVPAVNDNWPPPVGATSPTWHKSRMFVQDGETVYYSDIEKPESFNITSHQEPINPDDGDEITALKSAHDVLLVLKDASTHAITGDNPTSWVISTISPSIGAVSQQSVVTHGSTFWWDANKGPIRYAGSGEPLAIGVPDIGPTIAPALLAQSKLHLVSAVVDDAPARQRIMWAVPELGATRASLILPYNVLLGVWESDGWNPFDVASMVVAEDSTGMPWVYIGGYGGKLFQWWNATNDGVPVGQLASGLVASATSTTLTCTAVGGGSPNWTTSALKELYAYAISSDGLTIQRRRITANTANVLTTEAWGTVPNNTYTFVVGGIDFQFDTPWLHADTPFTTKRYEFLFLQVSSPSGTVPVKVDLFLNNNLSTVSRAETLTLTNALPDEARFRVSRTGRSWRARIRNINPDQELTLLKIAIQSVLLNTKS